MGRTVTVLALATLLAAPVAAHAEAVITPVGPWEASSSDGLCRVERKFAAGEQPHLVILEQKAPGPSFGLAVAGPSLKGLRADGPIRFGFFDSDLAIERPARVETNPRFGTVAVISDLAPYGEASGKRFARIDETVMTAMDRITVAQGDISLTFATGSLGEAAQLLNACTAKTMRDWGLDPARQVGLQRLAFPAEPQKLARKMIGLFANRGLLSGPFEAVALVDEAGKATGCRVLPGPGYDVLDAAACEVMTKARYLPALDAEGRPVASYWKTRVKFDVKDPELVQLSMHPGEP